VSRLAHDDVDPVGPVTFKISRRDRIAAVGSCFAQHIARTLTSEGFSYLVTEKGPADANYGIYPARFGNVYTPRQLLQLFDRAYGLFVPAEDVWTRPDGVIVDRFRPQIEPQGFGSVLDLQADCSKHFAAVRQMFETCDVLIFTLGLTEAWRSTIDGAIVPLAPGVVAAPTSSLSRYEFHNFTVAEMTADLAKFITRLRTVSPGARLILTVSPVALMATYEKRHVLASTTYSKSALRVVADTACRQFSDVDYFPSYEIITGPQARGRYFTADLREVTPEGVAHVMRLFSRHYLTGSALTGNAAIGEIRTSATGPENTSQSQELAELVKVMCDEVALDPNGGIR
jgi:hypothetical protein